jgi:hypothetical protein
VYNLYFKEQNYLARVETGASQLVLVIFLVLAATTPKLLFYRPKNTVLAVSKRIDK